MLNGSTSLTLDAKGRLSIPTRYRDALAPQGEGRIVLAPHPDGAVMIYPGPTWARLSPDMMSKASKDMRRLFLAKSDEVDLDATGRFLVNPELRKSAGLDRDVRLVGMGDYLELWDEQRYLQMSTNEATLQALREELATFGI